MGAYSGVIAVRLTVSALSGFVRSTRPVFDPSRSKRNSHPMKQEYFVGLGTLALINAGLAQAKNLSGLAWFLASLLLGPLATFLIVVLERGKKE